MSENYENNELKELKKLSILDDPIKSKIKTIEAKYNFFNQNSFRYTEQYISMMKSQFESFHILDNIPKTYGGKMYTIKGQDTISESLNTISSYLTNYISKLEALKYFDFLSEEKRNVILVGSNGCGKTTLLRYLIKNTNKSEIDYYQADRLLLFDNSYNSTDYFDKFKSTMERNNSEASNIDNDNAYYTIGHQFNEAITFFKKIRFIELEKKHEYDQKSIDETDKNDNYEMLTDYILESWNKLIETRELFFDFNDGMLKAKTKSDSSQSYSIKYLSSGEKSILFFLIKIILQEEKKYYFIDEPENNLNPSVISKLWDIIERKRPNSIFVYLTHNSEFVSSRINAKIYWIKNYEGRSEWEYEPLKENDELPQELMISLVGNKRTVLFCESENESKYDTKLYKVLYPDYKIVSAGGCDKVKAKVKAFKDLGLPEKAYGIIDCDYNFETTLDDLAKKEIYHVPFFEIENFLVCSKLLKPFLETYSLEKTSFDSIKKEVKSLFVKNRDIFIIRNVATELHFSNYDDGIKKITSIEELKKSYSTHVKKIDIDALIKKYETRFTKILSEDDYDIFLRYLDKKNIIKELEPKMELKEGIEFDKEILPFIKSDQILIDSLKRKYLPKIM